MPYQKGKARIIVDFDVNNWRGFIQREGSWNGTVDMKFG